MKKKWTKIVHDDNNICVILLLSFLWFKKKIFKFIIMAYREKQSIFFWWYDWQREFFYTPPPPPKKNEKFYWLIRSIDFKFSCLDWYIIIIKMYIKIKQQQDQLFCIIRIYIYEKWKMENLFLSLLISHIICECRLVWSIYDCWSMMINDDDDFTNVVIDR